MTRPRPASLRALCVIAAGLSLIACRGTPEPRDASSPAASTPAAAATQPSASPLRLPAGRYKTLRVTETAGLDRAGWPVVVGVPVPAGADAAKLTLIAEDGPHAGKAVPHQVVETLSPEYVEAEPEKRPSADKEVRLVELCFLADLPAGATAAYRLYHNLAASEAPPAMTPKAALTISDGAGGAGTIDTGPARFTLHHPSGQLLSYWPKHTGFPGSLTFLQGAIHWNPDVWAPPLRWGHVSEWGHPQAAPDTAPTVLRANGPIVCQIVRSGKMPWSNGVRASVSYTFFAGQPFVLESSLMEFTADTRVNAVRTNEMTFSRGQHTHAFWSDPPSDRGIATMRVYDPGDPKRFFGVKEGLSPEVPWIGLYHERHGYGIAAVNLSRTALSPRRLAGPQDDSAHYYVNDGGLWGTTPAHYEMNFVYFCRSEVAHETVVPEGSIFAERSAYLVFDAGRDGAHLAEVERWSMLLRHPPRVEVK